MISNIPVALWTLAKNKLLRKQASAKSVERLAICYKCNDRSEQCPVCLCFVQAKVLIEKETCPKELWP